MWQTSWTSQWPERSHSSSDALWIELAWSHLRPADFSLTEAARTESTRRSQLWWLLSRKNGQVTVRISYDNWFLEQVLWMFTRPRELLRRWCTVSRDSPERAKVTLEEVLGISILPTSPSLPLVRHLSCLRNQFVVRACGRTSFEELTMSKVQSPLINSGSSGERVWGSRGQTGLCVGPWYLVGPIDKDKWTPCRHETWSDPSQDGETASWNTEVGQRALRCDEICALVDWWSGCNCGNWLGTRIWMQSVRWRKISSETS